MIWRDLMLNNNYSLAYPLSEDELDQIHAETMKILAEEGIKLGHEKALEICKKNNLKTEGNKVFLSSDKIEEALEKIPGSFTLKARNPRNNVEIGTNASVLGPALGPPFIMRDGEQEYASYEDYVKLLKLVQSSPYLDLIGGGMVPPTDLPEETRHRDMFYAAVKYGDKSLIAVGSGAKKSKECLEMAKIVLGKEKLNENYYLFNSIGVSSPLTYDAEPLETLITWARSGQPLGIYSQILAGMTGPITPAGTLTLQNAEILAGAVLTQLINPGIPVVYSSFSSATDMNTGKIKVGGAHYSEIIGATVQLANYYDLPSRVGGGLTDAEQLGAQAGYESMLNMFTAVGYGADMIFFTLGSIKNYLGVSYEKVAADMEILQAIDNFQDPIEVNEKTLARDVIAEVGAGGNYMTHPQTLKQLENRKKVRDTVKLESRKERIREILTNYQQPDLKSEVEEKLLTYIE